MNFKYFVIGIYLTFVSLIVMMVFKSCNQKIELETKNYYNEELAYQSVIDAKKIGMAYSDSFQVVEKEGEILISYPESVSADSMVLNFKKPNNEKADKKVLFLGNKISPMPINDFEKGVYNLSIRSYKNNKVMLVEKKIKI